MISVQSFRDLGLFLHKILGFSQDLMGEVSQLNHSQEHHFVSLTHAVSQLQKEVSSLRSPPRNSEAPQNLIFAPESTEKPTTRGQDLRAQNTEAKARAAEDKVLILEKMNQSLKIEKAALAQQNQELTQALERLNEQQLSDQTKLQMREQQIQKLRLQLLAKGTLAHKINQSHQEMTSTAFQIPPEWDRINLNYLTTSDDNLSPDCWLRVSDEIQNPNTLIHFEETSSTESHYLLFRIGRSAQYVALPRKMNFDLQQIITTGLARVYHFAGQGQIQDVEYPALLKKQEGYFKLIQQGRLTLG